MEDLIREFLKTDEFPNGSGDGSGYGDGYGSGYGDGYGDGYGSGSGDGSGDGSGYGDGSGSGDGDGSGSGDGSGDGYGEIKRYNGQDVYSIDGVLTLIDAVHGNYARGRIIQGDLTTRDCFIAKKGNYFAHGDTLKEAFDDVNDKFSEDLPIEERIALFNAEFPDREAPVSARRLFDWHHILTGSCLAGRMAFCRDKGINLDGMYSVNDFIRIVEGAYGWDIVKQLKNK